MNKLSDHEFMKHLRGKRMAVPPSFWPGSDPRVRWFMQLEKIVSHPNTKGIFFRCRLQDQDANLEDAICDLKRRDVTLAVEYSNSLFREPAHTRGLHPDMTLAGALVRDPWLARDAGMEKDPHWTRPAHAYEQAHEGMLRALTYSDEHGLDAHGREPLGWTGAEARVHGAMSRLSSQNGSAARGVWPPVSLDATTRTRPAYHHCRVPAPHAPG